MGILKNKKVKTIKENKKFNLRSLIWLGFNYTCGMAFPLTFGALITDPKTGIGMYIFVVLILGSLIAGCMGYGYAKLSRVYIKSNGGTYSYVRASFGRFWGWFIGAFQYLTLPLAVTSMILSMISINFSGYVKPDPTTHFAGWGPYWSVYLNLIGIVIYALSASSIFLGIKFFKGFIDVAGAIKWISTIFIVICAMALASKDNFQGFHYIINGKSGSDGGGSHLTFFNFNNAFISFFYFYAGFETYSTITKNVQNPSRTIPRSILWVTLLTLSFYVIVIIMFMGISPLTKDWFSSNPALNIGQEVAGWLGTVLVISSMISLKVNAAIQSSLYASGMLEPLAIEHYISPKFSHLNRDGISIKSASFNMILTILFTFLLTCLPILFAGNDNVSYSSLLGFSSLLILVQYLFVTLVLFKLHLTKKMTLRIWEQIIFTIVSVFLSFEIIIYVFSQFKNTLGISDSDPTIKINSWFAIVEIILFVFITISIIVAYYAYYMPVYRKRIQENPDLQARLNSMFEISYYATLEQETYKKLRISLKENYAVYKTEKEKKTDNLSLKNYVKTKKDFLVSFKKNIKKLKNTLNNEVKKISSLDFKQENWELINDLRNNYENKILSLKNKKNKHLFDLKMNNKPSFAVKYNFITAKKTIKQERAKILDRFIEHSGDNLDIIVN